MKKLLITTVLLTLSISSAIMIYSNNNLKTSASNSPSNKIEEISDDIDSVAIQSSISYYPKYYNNLDMLIDDASIIIKGEVVSAVGVANKNGAVYTDLEVKIDSVLSGSIEKTEILKLRSSGGEIDYNNYVKNVDSNILKKSGLANPVNIPSKIVNYADGIKQYEIGDSVVLFLAEHTPSVEFNPEKDSLDTIDKFHLTDNKYVIVGGTQGKFYYDESANEVFRYKLAEEISEITTFRNNGNKELETNFNDLKNKL